MNLSGLNKVYCPYCGCEMLLTLDWSSLYYRYKCTNEACRAFSPSADMRYEAFVKATTMYKPVMRPMTMEEVLKHIGFEIDGKVAHARNHAARPLYIELKDGSELSGILWNMAKKTDKILCPWMKTNEIMMMIGNYMTHKLYNRMIRFWPDEPTGEEKEAAKWEDEK